MVGANPSLMLIAHTPVDDGSVKVWYGLMRSLMDPQRAANKWLSQGINMFNSSAKGVLLIEENVVSNPRSLVSDWTRPNGIIQFKPDTLAQQRYQVDSQQLRLCCQITRSSSVANFLNSAVQQQVHWRNFLRTELLTQHLVRHSPPELQAICQ